MARVNLKTAISATIKPGDPTEPAVIELAVTSTREERSAAVARAVAGCQPIAIPFAKFNDGRGFSVARLLRSEQGFGGEILAIGHTIPDQALHLLRSGFDSVEVGDPARVPQWQKSLAGYRGAYQNAARNPLALRREAALEKVQSAKELEAAA